MNTSSFKPRSFSFSNVVGNMFPSIPTSWSTMSFSTLLRTEWECTTHAKRWDHSRQRSDNSKLQARLLEQHPSSIWAWLALKHMWIQLSWSTSEDTSCKQCWQSWWNKTDNTWNWDTLHPFISIPCPSYTIMRLRKAKKKHMSGLFNTVPCQHMMSTPQRQTHQCQRQPEVGHVLRSIFSESR